MVQFTQSDIMLQGDWVNISHWNAGAEWRGGLNKEKSNIGLKQHLLLRVNMEMGLGKVVPE